MFWRITMPLLRPVMALVLVLTVIGSFQIFDTVAVTTSGGPINATRVIIYYIYDQAFNRFHFGFASAMSFALFVLLVGDRLRATAAHPRPPVRPVLEGRVMTMVPSCKPNPLPPRGAPAASRRGAGAGSPAGRS